MLPTAKIGGGSAYELPSRLEIGHYVHLGVQTLVNTARPVTIGHEVGLGHADLDLHPRGLPEPAPGLPGRLRWGRDRRLRVAARARRSIPA